MERHAAAEHAQDSGSRVGGAPGGFLADLAVQARCREPKAP